MFRKKYLHNFQLMDLIEKDFLIKAWKDLGMLLFV